MHDRAVARPALCRFDPLVFSESRIREKVLIADFAFGRHVERLLRHVYDRVGLTDLPADSELARRRQVGLLSLGRPGLDPAVNQRLVFVAESRVVDKMTVLGISVPRWHALLLDD